MAEVFLEIILNARDLAASDIGGRDEIDDPLEAALSSSGLGEVTGGGGGSGVVTLDVEIEDEGRLDEALALIRRTLQGVNVPRGTLIKRSLPTPMTYQVYE